MDLQGQRGLWMGVGVEGYVRRTQSRYRTLMCDVSEPSLRQQLLFVGEQSGALNLDLIQTRRHSMTVERMQTKEARIMQITLVFRPLSLA